MFGARFIVVRMAVKFALIVYIFSVIVFSLDVAADSDEEETCSINFSDVVEACDGFNNDFVEIPLMTVGYVHNNKSAVSISGTMTILQSIDDEYQLEMKISKVSGSTCSDVMWVGASNICGSLKDENAPWYNIVQQLDITECPIVEGDYEMDNLMLEDGSAADFCSPRMIGDYCIQLSVLNKMNDQVSCYISYVAIEEPEEK